MSRNIFCSHVISPVSALIPRASEMPVTSALKVRAFESQKEAAAYSKEMANKRSAKATETLTSLYMSRCLMPGIALTYQVTIDDADFAKFQSDKEKGPVFMSLDDQEIKTTNAHLYEDVLHPVADMKIEALPEEIANRWYNFRHMESALSNSPSKVTGELDMTAAAVRDNLRVVYATDGLFNTQFAFEQNYEEALREIEKATMNGDFGITYVLVVKEVEKQYRDTYHQAIYNGETEAVAIANAGLAACEVLRVQAEKYEDNAMLEAYLNPTIAKLQVEAGAVTDDTAVNMVEND